VFPCLSPNLDQDYCFGFGVGFAEGVAVPVVVFAFTLCFRGFIFIAPPPVVNETFFGSPGTLVSVKLSPTFSRAATLPGAPRADSGQAVAR